MAWSSRTIGIFLAMLCAALAAQAASAEAATTLLPDLVADPPDGAVLQGSAFPDGTNHLLLRFNGYMHNIGPGALEMRGSQRVGNTMTAVTQRVYRDDGSFVDYPSNAQIVWEPTDGHNHWHVKAAARWSLWDYTRSTQVAPAMKVGFCLGDDQWMESVPGAPPNGYYTYDISNICARGDPTASSTMMGISAGWRDRYSNTTAFQWVDVSDVQPGTYWLRGEVDPDNVIREANETNPPAFDNSSSTIPGYLAKPVNVGAVSRAKPTVISLAADSVGSGLGARAFRITTMPRHGFLNEGLGTSFSKPSVTYTPEPGSSGNDSFTYEAHDSSSAFPLHPATAAVTVGAGSATGASSLAPTSRFRPRNGRVLRRIRLGTDGRSVTVELRSRRAGLVLVRVVKGHKLLGRCRAHAKRGRLFICRVPLRHVWRGRARVTITLRAHRRLIDVMRFTVSEAEARAGSRGAR